MTRRAFIALFVLALLSAGVVWGRAANSANRTPRAVGDFSPPVAHCEFSSNSIGDEIEIFVDLRAGREATLVFGSLAPDTEVTNIELRMTRVVDPDLDQPQPRTGSSAILQYRRAADVAGYALDRFLDSSSRDRHTTGYRAGRFGRDTPPPQERRFWVPTPGVPSMAQEPGEYVVARLHVANETVAVYCDPRIPREAVPDATVQSVAQNLQHRVLLDVERFLGEIDDLDGDGRLTVLITPLLETIPCGPTPLRAFVRSHDFLSQVELPTSNHADLIYVNSARITDPGLDAVFTHEVTHLAAFSLRLQSSGHVRDEEWIDEGLAHAVEVRATSGWSNLADRLQAFRTAPHRSPLVVSASKGGAGWRDPGSRGATALFMDYLCRRCGANVLRELVTGDSGGISQIELATGVSFDELFRDWSIDLHCGQTDIPPGNQGPVARSDVKNRPFVDPVVWKVEDESVNLSFQGTTTRAVRMGVDRSESLWRVVVRGSSTVGTQVTVVSNPVQDQIR
ncbi:MAG: hypothetical protein NT069_35175 [Planctomycetota bacterium]|nr:hypothetical protein [Planctomycetota bacterium]